MMDHDQGNSHGPSRSQYHIIPGLFPATAWFMIQGAGLNEGLRPLKEKKKKELLEPKKYRNRNSLIVSNRH